MTLNNRKNGWYLTLKSTFLLVKRDNKEDITSLKSRATLTKEKLGNVSGTLSPCPHLFQNRYKSICVRKRPKANKDASYGELLQVFNEMLG